MHELGKRMSSQEFSLWLAEYVRNPWGEFRDGIHAAAIQQTIANYAGKIRRENAPLSEFLIEFDRAQPEPQEMDPATYFESLQPK